MSEEKSRRDDSISENGEELLGNQCPACGGDMIFDPDTGALLCPYCDSEKAIPQTETIIVENALQDALSKQDHLWNEDDIKSYKCQNCGAEIVFDAHTKAQFCNYCGSSHIEASDMSDTIPPGYVLPFTVSKEKSETFFIEWIRKKWLAPRDLKTVYKNERLMGTYIPYWTYDAETYSTYTAQRGDYYYVTRTRTVNGKTETYTERRTRWTSVSGDYDRFFDDVLVSASDKLNKKLVDKVEPFHLAEIKNYQHQYLAGFYAEKYSVNLDEGWNEAHEKMVGQLESEIISQIGGDTVRFLNVSSKFDQLTYKHLLLPLWLSSYLYKEKTYQFMVNGQTGEVVGEYPKSPIKIGLLILLGIAIVTLILLKYNNII